MRRLFVAVTVLVLLTTGLGPTAFAAKPSPAEPEFQTGLGVSPLASDCVFMGDSIPTGGRVVKHSLTVNGVQVAEELAKVRSDGVQLEWRLVGASGAYVTAGYDTYLYADMSATNQIAEAHLTFEGECVAPDPEPYLDIYTTRRRGRAVWGAVAVAGDWELALADTGRFSFPGSGLEEVWVDGIEVDPGVMRYELAADLDSRLVTTASFDLFGAGDLTTPITSSTVSWP